jgi:dynein heavy chain
MIRLIQCYVEKFSIKPEDEDEEWEVPKDIEDKLFNSLTFAAIWGIGGCLEETTRPRYDAFLKEVLNGEDVISKHKIDLEGKVYEPMKLPSKISDPQSLFELYYDQEDMKWVNWMQTVPKYQINKDATYLEMSIPTVDSIRMNAIIKTLLTNNKHCLLVGPTGTGKSMSMQQLLKSDFDNESWTYYALGFSAQTSAN